MKISATISRTYLLMLCLILGTAASSFSQTLSARDSISQLLYLGIAKSLESDIEQSLKHLQNAHKLCMESGENEQLPQIYMYIGENYHNLNACEEANKYYGQAAGLYSQQGNKPNAIFCQYCIANSYASQYEYSRDKRYLDSAFLQITQYKKYIENLGEREMLVTSLIVSRILLAKSENSKQAKKMSQEALSIIREGEAIMRGYDMREYNTNFLINKARAYTNLDMQTEAETVLQIIIEDSLSQQQLQYYYPMIINHYKKSGQYDKVLQYTSKTRRLNYLTYNVEHASNAQKYTAKLNFDEQMRKHKAETEMRDQMFELNKKGRKTINNYMLLAIVIIAIIVLMMARDNSKLHKQNKQLSESKDEIEKKNHELQAIHDTIEKQNEEISKQYQTILQQTQIFRIFRKRMGEAMRLAKSIQDALMPSRESMASKLGDHFIYWKPVAPVSGDFYWMRHTGSYTYVMCADCTGHSVPGALLSMLGISIMNDISSELDLNAEKTTPAQILDRLKLRFTTSLHIGKKHIDDSIDLALIKIDQANRKLQYAGANRPLLLVSDNQAMEFKPTKLCIGYNVIERSNFTNNVIDYEANDMVFLYTDGVTDQFGDVDGHTKFGTKRFHELLSNISDLPPQIQQSAIAANITNWTNIDAYSVTAEQLDDQLVMGIRMK
ncbi:MAG: SpoIIE family protein phosphatase [Bacteroidales bacterium]|nr:SpoIIE family protein phosphatase [Bacteroidales bacterium]